MISLRSVSLGIAAAAAITTFASPLTPQEALDAALASVRGNGAAMLRTETAGSFELAYTVESQQKPTVYVFSPTGAEAQGFMVVSADDAARPLLGYSETTRFDPANMPPQLRWWLDCYSVTVAELASNPQKSAAMALGRSSADPGHEPVAPLCATKWNQSSPFNNQCPIVAGQRSVTGCVATAMAQVMKVHQWPETGTGSLSYTWEVNGTQYSDSFDFGATTFNWGDMLNEYTSSATAAQKDAVATLMHACGVAAQMNYSPQESGAMEYRAATGMIDYLGYDAAMTVQNREWYLADAWDSLIYGELAAGRPVMYGGSDGESGHEFVCDGYSTDGYYHINWGWGGAYDGYFLLTDLYPQGQGIGGGSGKQGFNFGQTALIGAKKAEEGSQRVPLIGGSDVLSDQSTYTISSGNSITITTTEGSAFYNFSTCDLENVYIGAGIENDEESHFINCGMLSVFPQFRGITSYSAATTAFPEGTWRAYPAFSFDRVNWTPMKYDAALTKGYLDMKVANGTITVDHTDGVADDRPEATETLSLDVESLSVDPFPANGIFVLGKTYGLTFVIKSNMEFDETFYALIVDTQTNTVKAQSTAMHLSSEEAASVTGSCNLAVPKNLDTQTTDRYALYLGLQNGSNFEGLAAWHFPVSNEETGVGSLYEDFDEEIELYDLQGRRVSNPEPGNVYIVRTGVNRKGYRLLWPEGGSASSVSGNL